MYLIVGLGNPEPEYSNTRHNMGFNTINQISKEYNIEVNKNKFNGLYAKAKIEGNEVILLKPQTFMNLSGTCIREFINFYKIDIKNLIVIYDEIQVEPGKIRIRKKGSSGGHNGMKSVIENLGTEEFSRIRIGIGNPVFHNDMINYVIGKIDEETSKVLEEGVTKAKDAVIEILKNGIDSAMNKFN
jgi:PTH1 family peptidyl-tRNA hydrolase